MAIQSIRNSPCFEMFEKRCCEHGFTRRGAAFFRVVGDGVLQVLKYNYERMGPHYSLDIGLFSMYDNLRKEWFTSGGCIPRYTVMKLAGWPSTSRPDLFSADSPQIVTLPPELWYATPEEQLDVLESKGFLYLNEITTQKQLAHAICELDEIPNRSILWNDSLKFVPFLHAGQKDNALRVIDAILKQHKDAVQSWREYFSPDVFEVRRAEQEKKDQIWFDLREMVINDDEHSIKKYLKDNYERNLQYANFCIQQE